MSIAATAEHEFQPVQRRWMVMLGVYLISTIQFLDTTIANVALPHMQTSLGASLDSVTWVLTSYMLAGAIALPTAGWLATRLGHRNLFLLAAGGFIAASAACGAAGSLPAMVLFRVLQGLFSAFLIPLSNAVMLDVTPKEKHVSVISQWSMIAMAAPILGPLLGGYITEHLNWRWVFYMNVPVGLPGMLCLWLALPNSRGAPSRFDFAGFVYLALALASLQLMLDRGHTEGWFESAEIVAEAVVAACAFWLFMVHSVGRRDVLIDFAILQNRSLVIGIVIMFVMGFLMFGLGALLPAMVQQVYGYPVVDAGLVTMPRGVGTLIGLSIVGFLMRYVPGHILVVGGYGLSALTLHFMARWSPIMGGEPIIWWSFVQGFGMGLTFTPVNALVYEHLAPALRTTASSLLMLARNIGASVGLSLFASNLAWSVQANHQELGERLSASIAGMSDTWQIAQATGADRAVLAMADREINHQALMIGYLNDFALLFWVIIAALPFMLLLRAPRRAAAAAG